MQPQSNIQLSNEMIFKIGSWWIWNNELLVAGGPTPGISSRFSAGNRVYLYRAKDVARRGPIYCVSFLTFDAALVKIKNGEIIPCIPENLSVWSIAEQEYYRTA